MTVYEASVNVIRASVKYLCTFGPKEFLDIEEALQKRPKEE